MTNILGVSKTYYSEENSNVDQQGELSSIPIQFMAGLNSGGLPLSILKLKVGVPVMLLRNLRPSKGICNGTILIITVLKRNFIQDKVLTGPSAGDDFIIPKIKLTDDTSFHFSLTRWQFPIKLAFSMTVNKSQGQSISNVGIDLSVAPFSHGQLYVALSRLLIQVRLFFILTQTRHITRQPMWCILMF